MTGTPTTPGYYWAKLKTPSEGYLHGILDAPIHVAAEQDWISGEWEIVEVHDNNGEPGSAEEFSVSVFGIPVTQWPLDFFWGPKVDAQPPARQTTDREDGK
jgi:hypothetical protein